MSCIVHVGHEKTGSSFLQSMLARNIDTLRSIGIRYPSHPSLFRAQKGLISSGNGSLLMDPEYEIEDHALYSNELLHARLAEDEKIMALKERAGGDLSIVIYMRDLFDHSFSAWGQEIKRGGYAEGYNFFMQSRYGAHLEKARYWIDASSRIGFNLSVFNYSRHKSDLWPHFVENVLKADGGIAWNDSASDAPVNRSLSLSEYEIQRLFNKYSGAATSGFVSDCLVNELPNVRSERPRIDAAIYDQVVSRLQPSIDHINAHIAGPEEIRIEPFESLAGFPSNQDVDRFAFSTEQLEVLVRSLCQKLDRLLLESDADDLRDIAVKIEKGKQLDIEDALFLMSLAKRSRPHGPVIQKKIEEYKARLNASGARE